MTAPSRQTDRGVAFEKALANALGGFPGKGGQRNGGNGCVHIHFEKAPVDAEDHLKGQHPDKQPADQRDGPQWDGFKEPAVLNGRDNFRWQHSGLGLSKTSCLHDGGDHPLHNVQQCQH